MKVKLIFLIRLIVGLFAISTANEDENIFSDYCHTGLCNYTGGEGAHTGCKKGVPHNGKFQYPPCSDNATLIKLTEEEKQYILDFHNIQRNYVACGGLFKEYGLGPGCRHAVMSWDKELEKTAYLHTSYCTFEHDKCRNTLNYPFSGQNLGLITFRKRESSTFYINVISHMWYMEYTYTTMDMINAYYHQTKYMVGHFLTAVNERNNRVGCTFASFFSEQKKKNAVMLSCNYPTTNIARSSIYNSCKKPASKCATGTDAKYKFLCSPAENYDVSSILKNTPYDGDGKEIFKNCGRNPELFHYEADGGDEVIKTHQELYSDKPLATEEQNDEEDDIEEHQQFSTTKQPAKATTEKPTKGTTKKPGSVPGLDNPEGNPSAGGEPDYSEDQYDPLVSSARKFYHKTQLYIYISFLSGPLITILF